MIRILFTALLIIQSSSLFAIGQPISDKADIMGCWKRVLYPQEVMEQMSKSDFYHPELQKHQWYCFFEDGVFRLIASSQVAEYSTEEIKENFKGLPAVMLWKWVKDSVVWVEHKEDKNLNSHWIITRIDKDLHVFGNNLLPKGTLFMAIPTPDLSSFITVRVLEKTNN